MAAIINMFEIDNNYQKPEDAKQKEESQPPPSNDPGTTNSENLMPIIADSRIYASKENTTMTSGFVKTNRALALKLAEEFPHAAHLLHIIALRAVRFDCPITGLKAGEAKITFKDSLSEQIYRTSIQKLIGNQQITIRTTNRCTIAKLCNSDIYDLNNNLNNEQNNKQTTNKQRTERPTRINSKKKETINNTGSVPLFEIGCVKISYEFKEQMEVLHGVEPFKEFIEGMADYCASNGKTYVDYEATVRNWIRKAGGSIAKKEAPSKPSTPEENYEWAKQFDRNDGGWTVKADTDAWRVASWTDGTKNAWLGYKDRGFRQQVQSTLRKFNLWTTSAT